MEALEFIKVLFQVFTKPVAVAWLLLAIAGVGGFFHGQNQADVWQKNIFTYAGAALTIFALFRLVKVAKDPRWLEKWRPNTRKLKWEDNESCQVYHEITAGEYSCIAAEACRTKGRESVFTVLRIEPVFFLDEIIRLGKVTVPPNSNTLSEVKNLGKEKCRELIDTEYPHFKAFREFSESHPNGIHRIIIAPEAGWSDRNRASIEVFRWLNDPIKCFVVNRRSDEFADQSITFWTDYVIFDKKTCFDYYHESETLIMSDDHDAALPAAITRLAEDFALRGNVDTIYIPIANI